MTLFCMTNGHGSGVCIIIVVMMEKEEEKENPLFNAHAYMLPPTHFLFILSYYPDIFKMSGFADMEKKYGEWFDYNESPRAKIFARNHTDVTDLTSMMALMRSGIVPLAVVHSPWDGTHSNPPN